MKKIIFWIAFLFSFAHVVFAANVFTSDSNGTLKTIFYPNDTVYLAPTATNITTNSTNVSVYIVADSNSWSNQTVLHDVTSTGFKNFTTNATGFLNTTNAIWLPILNVGNYDVVIDVNGNGIYDGGIDFVFDPTVTGFQVVPLPAPTLDIAVGENNTVNKTVTLPTSSPQTVMMQIKMTAGNSEAVSLTSMSLWAMGSGDSSKGISLVTLVQDLNQNGVYDPGEPVLAGSKYFNAGIATLDLSTPQHILAGQSIYFLIVYTLTNSSKNGDTYGFQIITAQATGDTTGDIVNANTQINSPILTISSTISASTTTTAQTQTPTISQTSTTTATPASVFTNYFWIFVAGAISITVIIFFVILYTRASRPYEYEYKPPTQ